MPHKAAGSSVGLYGSDVERGLEKGSGSSSEECLAVGGSNDRPPPKSKLESKSEAGGLRSRTYGGRHFRMKDRGVSRAWRRRLRMPPIWRILLIAFLAVAFVISLSRLPADKILNGFLIWIQVNLGPWGPIALALAYIPLTVLAVPASILTVGGGYLFGLPIGFLADSIGATLGATAAFLVGKMVGRSFVASKLKHYPQFQAIALAIQRSSFKIVLLLRLVPLLPFNVLNYLLSVTPVNIGQYILATWIGMMPITFALVYVGTTIKDLSDATNGWGHFSTSRWILLTVGLTASAFYDNVAFPDDMTFLFLEFMFPSQLGLLVAITQVAKKSLNKAIHESESSAAALDVINKNDNRLDLHKPLVIQVGT